MSGKKKIGIAAVSVLLIGVLAFAVVGAWPAQEVVEEVRKDIVVETAEPQVGSIVVTGEYIGTVEPGQQVMVFPKLAGEVLEVNVSVGDTVQEGDVLFKVDSTALQSQINQTAATISAAEARAQHNLKTAQDNLETYKKNQGNGGNTVLLQAEAALENAQTRLQTANSTLATARRNLRDHRDLDEFEFEYSSMGVTYDARMTQLMDAVVQAEIAQESAQLGIEQAEASLEAAKISVHDQEESVESNVKLAELNTNFSDQYIALQQLRRNLADATVTAPIGGQIEQCNVEQFNMASSASPAVIISNKDNMTVSFKIPESSLEHIKLGDSITVDKNGKTGRGTVTEIGTMVDAGGLFTVKANVRNFSLHTGSSIKIYADNQKTTGAILLPVDAVYYDDGKPYVYRVQDGVASQTFIETGIHDGESVEVLSGIGRTDKVIMTWNANLADGVEVVEKGAEPEAAPALEEPAQSADTSEVEESSEESDGGEAASSPESGEEAQ